MDKQGELYLLCKHFLNLPEVDIVRVQAIDRLGRYQLLFSLFEI